MVRQANVPKLLADLITELLQSLLVVRDSLVGLGQGGTHQAIPLSGQLRALLLERRRDAHALLLEVAEQLDVRTTIFVMDGAPGGLPPGLPEPIFHLAGFPYSRTRELAGQSEIPLRDLEARNLIQFDGEDLSVRDVVEFFANRAGGAHYSKSMPESFSQILALGLPGMFSTRGALIKALQQIGRAVYETGVDLVRRVTDLDLILDLGLPTATPLSCFVDAAYPGLPMRLTVGLDEDQHLVAHMAGIDGERLAVRLPDSTSWAESHLVHVTIRHTDELHTVLRISIDDDLIVAEAQSAQPIFLANEIRDYDLFVNKSVDAETTASAMALGQLGIFSHSTPTDLANVLAEIVGGQRDPQRKVVLYTPGSHGVAISGQRDLVHTGDVTLSQMAVALQAGEDPESRPST